MPSHGENISKLQKKDHFKVVCKYKRKIKRIESTDTQKENAKIYSINTPNPDKNNRDCHIFHEQIEARSDVTLIPRIFWDEISKHRLTKSYLHLKHFD